MDPVIVVAVQDPHTLLTGNFPGSPVDLRFFFRLERSTIASLEITP